MYYYSPAPLFIFIIVASCCCIYYYYLQYLFTFIYYLHCIVINRRQMCCIYSFIIIVIDRRRKEKKRRRRRRYVFAPLFLWPGIVHCICVIVLYMVHLLAHYLPLLLWTWRFVHGDVDQHDLRLMTFPIHFCVLWPRYSGLTGRRAKRHENEKAI